MPAAIATAGRTPAVWRRLLCILYEALLLTAVFFAASLLMLLAARTLGVDIPRALFQAYLFVVAACYFVPQWHAGQTLPMKTWHIRLVSRDGSPVSWGRAAARYALALASWTLLGAGHWWAIFDPERQFLHDRLAGTQLVVPFAEPHVTRGR